MSITPRQALHWSTWVAVTTAPITALALVGWVAGLWPDTRQMAMAYMTLLLVCVGAGIIAALSACNLAIHRAFSAGFQTGEASVDPGAGDPLMVARQRAVNHDRTRHPHRDPLLELVE